MDIPPETAEGAPRRQGCRLIAAAMMSVLLVPATAVFAQGAQRQTDAGPAAQTVLSDQDAAELKRRLLEWFAAFSARNYAAIDQYFSAPYTEIASRTIIYPDMSAVHGIWERTREALDGTNYSHTQAVAIRVIPRSPTLALLNIHWRRVNKDGSTLNEGSEFYFATKQTGQWRFNGGMSQELAEFGRRAGGADPSPR